MEQSESDQVASGESGRPERVLVREILDGSTEAWHQFLKEYGGLVYSVVRRYAHGDEDDTRNVFVDVLERLLRQSLRSYEGRAALSTWLVVVVRNQTLDHVRRRLGRRELPAALAKMSKLDQKVFRLYHWEGLPFEEARERLQQSGFALSASDLGTAIRSIESRLDSRSLRRYLYDSEARSVQALSGRLLEYQNHCRESEEWRRETETPLGSLLEKEVWDSLARLEELMERLPEAEREVLHLRFYEEKSASEVAAALQLKGGQRQAYTIAERGLRRLRRWLGDDPISPEKGEA